MLFSAAFTLACKYRISPAQVFKKYGKHLKVEYFRGSQKKEIELAIPKTLSKQKMRAKNH
jgi:hypothetical protein